MKPLLEANGNFALLLEEAKTIQTACSKSLELEQIRFFEAFVKGVQELLPQGSKQVNLEAVQNFASLYALYNELYQRTAELDEKAQQLGKKGIAYGLPVPREGLPLSSFFASVGRMDGYEASNLFLSGMKNLTIVNDILLNADGMVPKEIREVFQQKFNVIFANLTASSPLMSDQAGTAVARMQYPLRKERMTALFTDCQKLVDDLTNAQELFKTINSIRSEMIEKKAPFPLMNRYEGIVNAHKSFLITNPAIKWETQRGYFIGSMLPSIWKELQQADVNWFKTDASARFLQRLGSVENENFLRGVRHAYRDYEGSSNMHPGVDRKQLENKMQVYYARENKIAQLEKQLAERIKRGEGDAEGDAAEIIAAHVRYFAPITAEEKKNFGLREESKGTEKPSSTNRTGSRQRKEPPKKK
jgi:hypothetical protein